jgi:hypothetical protein
MLPVSTIRNAANDDDRCLGAMFMAPLYVFGLPNVTRVANGCLLDTSADDSFRIRTRMLKRSKVKREFVHPLLNRQPIQPLREERS